MVIGAVAWYNFRILSDYSQITNWTQNFDVPYSIMAELTSQLHQRFMLTVIAIGCVYISICLGASTVTIQENSGYTELVVSIGERVPEDEGLLQKIKEDFTDASRFLFEATQEVWEWYTCVPSQKRFFPTSYVKYY